VRGKADPSFGQIEPELAPHRAAEPGIALRFRRPDTFHQTAEHHAIGILQTRFERAVDAHARIRRPGPAHHAACGDCIEQFRIIRRLGGKLVRRRAFGHLIESQRQCFAVP
jgi:hypothetical protein